MTLYTSYPYVIPPILDRWYWYELIGLPTAVFDGVLESVGAYPDVSWQIEDYAILVDTRLAVASPLVMSVDLARDGTEVTATVEIAVDQTVTTTNNEIQFFVCEDGCGGQSNLVRAFLASEPLTLTDVGENVTVVRTFTLDPTWNTGIIKLLAFVQSLDSKEILQGGFAAIEHRATVAVDCIPDAADAPWHLQGPGGFEFSGRGDRTLLLPDAGEFTLTWLDMPTWTSADPAVQVQTCPTFGSIAFSREYAGDPFTAATSGPLAIDEASYGAALVDFDNDDDLDIQVINMTGIQLLRNDGIDDFFDVAASQLANLEGGRQAAWADFNEDGYMDFYLAVFGGDNVLMLGDSRGRYSESNASLPGDNLYSYGASWFNLDQDGDLDLYVVNYTVADLVLENLSELGEPVDFALASTDSFDSGATLTISWTDIDLDGRQDPYLSFYKVPNRMYLNTPEGMVDVTETTGLGNECYSMGSDWGDFDNDGDFDLYLANNSDPDCLYRNDGNLHFTKIEGPYMSDVGACKSVVWADFNNDTWLDLYVVRNNEYDLLLFGDGSGQFTAAGVGLEEVGEKTNIAARGDIDGDGRCDLFVTRSSNPNAVLYNNITTDNHWLQVKLTGVEDNVCGIGARVAVTTGSTTQQRLITSASGLFSMHSLSADFGLGQATTVDRVRIYWPNGTAQTLTDLAVDQVVEVTQDPDEATPVPDGQPLLATWLGQARPNPFNPRTTIDFALAKPGLTRLEIFGLDGSLVKTLVKEVLPAGPHRASWDGTDAVGRQVASGTYFYRLVPADGRQRSGSMVLLK